MKKKLLSYFIVSGILLTTLQPTIVKAAEYQTDKEILITQEEPTTYGLGGAIVGAIVGAADNLGDNVIDEAGKSIITGEQSDYNGFDVIKDIVIGSTLGAVIGGLNYPF